MRDGPDPSEPAALIGDPARAAILTALLDGGAWTASELALQAGVGAPTTSAHLAKLVAGGLIAVVAQGRHRYYRLAGGEVAAALEALMKIAVQKAPRKRQPGPRDAAMRRARTCYDHIAGELGVALFQGMQRARWIRSTADGWVLTPKGKAALIADLGIDLAARATPRREAIKPCLDWSERTEHLGGALGAALLERAIAARWVKRGAGRIIELTVAGRDAFATALDAKLP